MVGNPNIIAQKQLYLDLAVKSVNIVQNDTGINQDVRIVPINNSNGIVVIGAVTSSEGIVTLDLSTNPETGSGDSGFLTKVMIFHLKKVTKYL